MRAELISVGTELLLGQITDTNATYLARLLASYGVDVLAKQTVGDNLERVRAAVSLALTRSDLVITTGGLGPTEDDLTAEAVALAAGLPMVRHEETADRIAGFFARRGRTPVASVFRQAQIPSGAQVIPNRRGTAPGLLVPIGQQVVFMFPGVPAEMEALVADGLVPWLAERVGDQVIRSRVLRIAGMGESLVEERVRDLVHGANPTVAPLAKLGEVHLRITAKGPPATASALIDQAEAGLRERLGDAVFGVDDETLQAAVARLLIERGLTLAIAESCTAGVLASRLTEIPGSSAFMLAGFVAYSNEAKVRDLGVEAETIAAHGAVSAEVAGAMAEGARARARARVGVAVTGIAGPDGGTPAKPVGLVYLATATDAGTRTEEVRFGAEAGRAGIRHLAAQAALNLIRLSVLER
ncbi:MAG: competence/damage-inducible protein A [Armatimonadetes bacterium]|nr:competence/damage-inducible protein A [Armatimonadota bacterium]